MSPPSSTLLIPGSREPLASHGDDGKPYKILVGPNGGLRVEMVGDGSAAVTPGDTDANSAAPVTVVRIQGWDADAQVWRRAAITPTGLLVTEAALVDANTGLAFDSTNPFPVTSAQSLPVCWQVPATTTGRALLIAWQASHAYTVGEAVTNDTGKMYVCRTAGTSAASGGPTGTNADITDGTAHWSHVTSTPTTFKNSMVLRNQASSASALYYNRSAALAPGGAELPAGSGDPIFNADPTTIFIAATSTARATVVAYP